MKNTLFFLFCISLIFLLAAATAPLAAATKPLTLVIRAKAKDAKFIGSSIGGARIVVREALTERILAEGFTSGSTGDTERIMTPPHSRDMPLADEQTAAFTARLKLEKPTLVTIEGFAPWHQPQARIKVQTQLWLIPGKDIDGDGIILEFPGFVVNILNPQTHESIQAEQEITLSANVVLMCGCPITEGGLWDARKYEVQAVVERNGESFQQVPLEIGDKASTFKGVLRAAAPGLYQATVYAYDPETGNTGVATTNFIVK